ncbi:hypothetical protein BDZ91DRAFT_777725 [Kalaharituber pfeilii]|nr:hypothetical protein BDZ91DRAFT_777725 [Kalaharituber pfeilii]
MSVSSLDKDLARLRLAKYTSKDSAEIKEWLNEILGVSLPESKDLMDCLKDGVLLCRLVNLLPGAPQLKPKPSPMPFVQMEQIAAFINVVSKPPVDLPTHDLFLTVDLFEKKDPAQVVQCLTAFSRIAHKICPEKFPMVVGGKKGGMLSPTLTAASGRRDLNSGSSGVSGYSVNSTSSTSSSVAPAAVQPVFPPTSPPPAVGFNSVYKKPAAPVVTAKPPPNIGDDEKKSIPAWNIHQYGYMGGASQGNMGIVNPSPSVPSLKSKDEVVKKKDESSEAERRREEELRWQRLEEEEAKERARQQETEHRKAWQQEQDAKRERDFAIEKRQRDEAAQRKLEQDKAERERERARQARERERLYQLEKERHRLQPVGKKDTESERRFLKNAWTENHSSTLLTPIKTHKTGGNSPNLGVKTFTGIATHKTGGTPSLTPQKTGGLVAQRAGEFNRLPSPSLKTLTPGEYTSSGVVIPVPLTPHRTGEWRNQTPPITSIRSHKTGGERPIPPPRALPTPPDKKPSLPPRDSNTSPTMAPNSGYFTSQRTPSVTSTLSTASTLRRQNSWEHDNETVIDVPINRGCDEVEEKEKSYKWANMSFLERERERERERQKEWEKNQLEQETKKAGGYYRSQVMGPRDPR